MAFLPKLRISMAGIAADFLGGSARDAREPDIAASADEFKLRPPLHGTLVLGGRLPPIPWISLGWHQGTLRQIILNAKFYGDMEPWRSLAAPLVSAIELGWGSDMGRGREATHAVVPVPAAWSRRFTRGVDHVALLSLLIAGRLCLPNLHPLRRTGTGHSIGLSGEARRRRDCQFRPRMAPREALNGRRVVLVDDVQTTGATIRTCAIELLRIGAPQVLAVTASVTPCPVGDSIPSAGVWRVETG